METSTVQPENQAPAKGSAKEIWKGFETLEKSSQGGFQTAEQRLRAYAQFMQTVSAFFEDPKLISSPSFEQKDLVRRLVYDHAKTAKVPIEFFVEARERLLREVLPRGFRGVGRKWKEEIDFLKVFSKAEYNQAVLELGTEVTDRKKLEDLATSKPLDQSDTAVSVDIQTQEEMRSQIQEKAIQLLAKDPDLAQDIVRRNGLVAYLRKLLANYDPLKADQVLETYRGYLGTEVTDEAQRRIFLGQDSKAKQLIGETADLASKPDFVWKVWAEKGNIPSQLLDSFEEVMTFARLTETIKQSSGMEKPARARALLPFVSEGISASMISDIIEGKYQLPDEFIYKQIDAFIHFNDVYKDVKKVSPLKRKVMIAALAAMVATAVPDHTFIESKQAPAAAEEVQKLLKQVKSGEFNTPAKKISGKTESSGGQSTESKDSSNQKNESPSIDESGAISEAGGFGVGNASLEAFEKMMGIQEWKLSGKDPYGYYRTATMDHFENFYNGFNWGGEDLTPVGPGAFPGLGIREDVTFSRTITVREGDFEIPVQNNSLITATRTKDGYLTVGGLVRVEGIRNFDIFMRPDGTYYINFKKEDYGKKVTISFGLEKTNENETPAPSEDELTRMKKQIADVKNLPEDVQTFLKELNKVKDIPLETKARIIEQYVKTSFTYSLNPKWTDYYGGAKDTSNYFRRIFEIKKADCTPTNTALVALLRTQGIPARMVFGYRHDSAFLSGDPNKIVAAEGHGWTEAFIDGKWITLDGTASNLEDEVKDLLQKKAHSPGTLAINEATENIASFIESYKAFHREYPDFALWLDASILTLGAGTLSAISRRGNDAIRQKLVNSVYAKGSNYGEFPGKHNLMVKEIRRLSDLRADENFVSWVPPFLVARAIGDFTRAREIGETRATYRRGEQITSSEPNEFEFLTRVLGYKEADVKRRMYHDAYTETESALRNDVDAAVYEVSQGLNEQGQTAVRHFRWDGIGRAALERPADAASWQETKQRVKTELFSQYQTSVNAEAAKARAKLKDDTTYIEPQRLSEEQFSRLMDDVFRIQLGLWIAKDTYDAALAALPKS